MTMEEVQKKLYDNMSPESFWHMNTENNIRILHALVQLDYHRRHQVLEAMHIFFCPYCGSEHLPCYCMRDD